MKTVAALWEVQEETLRRQGAKDHQVREMRKAYFVGFWNALTTLRDDIGDADLPAQEGIDRLDALVNECEDFIHGCSQARSIS